MRNIAAALSACIYQCLCDSDSFIVSVNDCVDVGMEGFTSTSVVYKDSHLMTGAHNRRRQSCSAVQEVPTSEPEHWPGIYSVFGFSSSFVI